MLRRRMYAVGIVAGAAAALLAGCQAVRQAVDGGDGFAGPLTLSPAARARADALAAFAQAQLDEAHHDPNAALAHYRQAARLEPDDETLQLKVALYLLQRRDTQEALALLEALVRRHPRSTQALSWLAQTYQTTDRGDDAARTYQRLIQLAPRQPSGYLKLAAIYGRQGKDDAALRWLQRGLAANPSAPEICKALADLYARRARSARQPADARRGRQQALEYLERACRAAPEDTTLRSALGELYIADGQFARALAAYQFVEDRFPGQLQLKTRLARSFAGPERRDQALAFFEQQVARQPKSDRLLFYLGILQDAAGHADRAQDCLQRAANVATNALPVSQLALWDLQRGQTNTAIAAIEQGLRRWPDDPALLQMRAYLHLAQKEYVPALELFKKSLQQLKDQPAEALPVALYVECALAALKSGQLDDAAELLVQVYPRDEDTLIAFCQQAGLGDADSLRHAELVVQKVAARLPDNPQPLILLGQLRLAAKNYPAAILAFEQAQTVAQQTPGQPGRLDALFYFLFGSACERQGQFDRAERLLFQCLDRDAGFDEALNYLAYMWCEKGRHLDRALTFVKQALQHEPENGAYQDTLGWVYYQQGRYREALQPLLKAAELIPDDATICEHLGDLYLKLNDPPQAVRYWTTAYQLDSTNAGLAQKLRGQGVEPDRLLQGRTPLPARRKPPLSPAPATPGTNAPGTNLPAIPLPE